MGQLEQHSIAMFLLHLYFMSQYLGSSIAQSSQGPAP